VAPGMSNEIAKVIIDMKDRLSTESIQIIIDSAPQICRLGYGDIDAIEDLMNAGISISKIDSLRIGVLIVDGTAWVYSPVPLIVEDENEVKINAINVTVDQACELIDEIYETKPEKQIQSTIFDFNHEIELDEPVFSPNEYCKDDLDFAKKDLETRPPKKFDLERQVQVYTGLFQFVDLSLIGIGFRRMTLTIPSKLLAVSSDRDVQEKLKTTYKLKNENSKLSGKEIEDKVAQLRKTYTRSMGKRLGSVILLKNKEIFEKKVNKISKEIEKFSEKVKISLEKELSYTKKEISKILLPVIMKNPPDELKGIIMTKKPSQKIAEEFISDELSKFLPDVDGLITEMELHCDFKDITYEMLNDPLFQENIQKQFRIENFLKPFESFSAVQER
jgi:hypothetical protein